MKSPTDRQLSTLLHELLARLHASEYGEVYLSPSHFPAWDEQAISIFQKSGLLKETTPLSGACCNGCERGCFAPVEIEAATTTHPARAFIICEERDDMGMVPVPFDHLRQWRMGLDMLASTLALQLSCNRDPRLILPGALWHIAGTIINKQRHDVFLCHGLNRETGAEMVKHSDVATADRPILLIPSSITIALPLPVLPIANLLYFENSNLEINFQTLANTIENSVLDGIALEIEWVRRTIVLVNPATGARRVLANPDFDSVNDNAFECLFQNTGRTLSEQE